LLAFQVNFFAERQ